MIENVVTLSKAKGLGRCFAALSMTENVVTLSKAKGLGRCFAALSMTENAVTLSEAKGVGRIQFSEKPGPIPSHQWISITMKQYYVYILTNRSRTLYTGITNDLQRRMYEHKNHLFPGFTAKYNITQLMYFEGCDSVLDAIAREKQIKGWLRKKKIDLIESENPEWKDLSEGWFDEL